MAADDYHTITKHGKTTTASAVSPNSVKKPKERVPAKPDMPEVNCYLMCQLCSGYLIDATAIIECQHTFCKSCILKYLETNSYCPICDVQLNKAKPHLSLRSDVIIQRLVYKLVPGLLVSEIRRRRDFSIKNGMDSVEASELASNSIAIEIEAVSDLSTVLSLDDVVSLSVEYVRSSDEGAKESPNKIGDTNGKPPQQQLSTTQSSQNQQTQQQKSTVKSNSVSNIGSTNANSTPESNTDSNSMEQANDRRYLQCPAAVSVGLLKKFIRMKYGLSDDYRVDLLYNGDRDSILENDLTLLDVAFIFKWNKDDPMQFQYRIFERPPKGVMVYSGMKRPAPSVMDEPPDDDTASGPHNRSSMFSSSAPSSKLPRLADNTNTSGNQGKASKDNTSGKSTTSAPVEQDTVSTSTKSVSPAGKTNVNSTPTPLKVEKDEVEEEEDEDEDEEEDYELVEMKEHMKGMKSHRKNSVKESLKRSVASNLRSQIVSRSHSTDSKGSNVESERESSRNENSLNTSHSKRSFGLKVSKKRGHSSDGKEHKVESKGKLISSGKGISVDSLRVRVSSDRSGDKSPQTTGSLKLSISTAGVTPVVSSSTGGEKKEPLKLSLGSVLAKGNKSPERKHHKHKHHHHHKLRHRDKQGNGLASSTATVTSQKPLKLSLTLNPPSARVGTSTPPAQNQPNPKPNSTGKEKSSLKQSQQPVPKQKPNSEAKEQPKGKLVAGVQNFNNSARTSASAHGHLNNISKSISVSVNTSTGNSTTITTSIISKGNQYGNKILSATELIPKNTGIEIQPTTIPISHSQISQHPQQHNSIVSNVTTNNSNNSHKHSHPLLPDSVHVPKSVTLIPVNPPNAMNMSGNPAKGNTSHEKGNSGSQGNQNRINSHTFTHPITNKSLHQITVTEVPPPSKQNVGGNTTNTTMMGNNVTNSGSTHTSISGTSSNPIEKVIANANKPQFNGPGSMEITKIYCGTAKENPTKKLKDRKGLDISISGTGINVSVNKSSQKLEETLRQKVNIAIGQGNGSISVTSSNNSSSSGNTGMGNSNSVTINKMKSVPTAASLLSGKMPPGITIGPATAPQSAATNNVSNMNTSVSNNGNNIVKNLGFTLPPHLTAHPHTPNNNKNANNQVKSDKIPQTNSNNGRMLSKESISMIGKGNGGQQQQPPPVEITISAGGNGNKSQNSITARGINIMNKSKMSDPLTSIFDITQGLQKSPSLSSQHTNNAKELKGIVSTSISMSNSLPPTNSLTVSAGGSNKNATGKRPFDMTPVTGQNNTKKVVKESPETKRGRSASTSSEPGKTNTSSTRKPGEVEIPLDLSGRSTRTTPPIIIPHREPSKSPVAGNVSNDRRALSQSPDNEKVGVPIAPSPISNNFISTKLNQKNLQKESKQPPQSISVSKSSPTSKIGSIVDNLAQKQAQMQQLQKLQNSQQHQQQQQQQQQQNHHQHHHSPPANTLGTSMTSPNNNSHSSGGSANSSTNMHKTSPNTSNTNLNKGSVLPNSGLGNSLTATSLASPVMPITSSSPPGDHLRNLWTLSDAAARQGKLNSMNELLVAASLFSPPGHPHPLAGSHQLSSPTGPPSAFNSNMFAQFNNHLAALGASKIPPGMFDPHLMAAALNAHNANAALNAHNASAALNAHNASAAAHHAGMRMHPFVGSISPPLNMPNSYYSHGTPSQPTPVSSANTGIKIPNVTSKPTVASNPGAKSNSMPFAPLFSHSVPVTSPKSPTTPNIPNTKSPTSVTNSSSQPVLPFAAVSSLSNSNHMNSSSSSSEPKHSSSGSKNSGNSHHHESPLHTSNTGKSTKINGIVSTAMPVFPPGIHNPLLPSRNTTGNSSSANSFQSSLNKGFAPLYQNKNLSKGGIPNSMKISNFLPNKPKDSKSDANAEATITSGSNFGMPPLQAKPNFSLTAPRPHCEPSLNSIPSVNIPKSPAIKESPVSPVKSLASPILGNQLSPKPSKMTCASLLLPDSMYSKPTTHHLLNSLSPTKGDHVNLGLGGGRNRTPSTDSASPASASKTSPGALNKSNGGNKDGFRSDEVKSLKTVSPVKDENAKKEIGSIPMGPSGGLGFAKNFTTTAQMLHSQSLSLHRPMPTIPAFLNRSLSSNVGNHAAKKPLSSPSNSRQGSPEKVVSPVKIAPHLPSPVFPFPGVSVPVQVKLQDEVAPIVPVVTPSPRAVSTHSTVPVRDAQLCATKEDKIVNPPVAGGQSLLATLSKPSFPTVKLESRKTKLDLVTAHNSCEIPAKVQKVETDVSPSVKNESKVEPVVAVNASETSESNGNESTSTSCKGTKSESDTQRELKVEKIEGESNKEESKGNVADPSQLSVSPASRCTTQVETTSPEKATEKVVTAVVQPPPSVDVVLSEKQIKCGEQVEASNNSIEEEKSTTQITLDIASPKSDETSLQVNHQELKSFQIPVDEQSGQTHNEVQNSPTESDATEKMERLPENVLGQLEDDSVKNEVMTVETKLTMDDNQMEIDVEGIDEKMEADDKIEEESREKIETKEDEDVDVDVDVVGVGVDEPMEICTDETLPANDDEFNGNSQVEEICIDKISDEVQSSVSPMNVVDNDSSKDELIESHQENTFHLVDDSVNDKNEMESCEQNDSVEISSGGIQVEKLELAQDQQDMVDDENDTNENQVPDEFEEKIDSLESDALPQNEASNLSQDDSEYGDLVIDLDPAEDREKPDEGDNAVEFAPEIIDDTTSQSQPNSLPILSETLNEEKTQDLVLEEEIVNVEEEIVNVEEKIVNLEEEIVNVEEEIVNVEEEIVNLEEEIVNVEDEIVNVLEDDQPAPVAINMGIIEGEDEQPKETSEPQDTHPVSPAACIQDDLVLEPIEPQDANAEPLNQDSIPNQIIINSPPIDVNVLIKPEQEAEKREETDNISHEIVAECPHDVSCNEAEPEIHDDEIHVAEAVVTHEDEAHEDEPETHEEVEHITHENEAHEVEPETHEEVEHVTDQTHEGEAELETVETHDDAQPGTVEAELETRVDEDEQMEATHDEIEDPTILVAAEECEHSGVDIENNACESKDDCEVEQGAQLEENSSLSPIDLDALPPLEDNSILADNEQESVEGNEHFEEEQQHEMEQLSPVSEPLPAEEIAVVCSVEEDNTGEAIVEIDNVEESKQEPVLPQNENNMMDNQNIVVVDDTNLNFFDVEPPAEILCFPGEQSSTPMEVDEPIESEQLIENSLVETPEEIDEDECMQIELDLPVAASSPCMSAANEVIDEPVINIEDECVTSDVAMISATITASAVATGAVALEEDDENTSMLTPTTSTSSVAIKLDISANDDCGRNAAESHLPSSTSRIPCSNNTSNSSSSSSSPVDGPATGLKSIGSPSLETFGKVAAGLIASATSTINNNNNNTSLAPTSCDAISIATTNANA